MESATNNTNNYFQAQFISSLQDQNSAEQHLYSQTQISADAFQNISHIIISPKSL